MGNAGGCVSGRKRGQDSYTVRKRSKAEASGLNEGDVVVSVNGLGVESESQQTATDAIDQSSNQLVIGVARETVAFEDTLVEKAQSDSFYSPSTHPIVHQRFRPYYNFDNKEAEESKRIMRERYAISNVFEKQAPAEYSAIAKVRSAENISTRNEPAINVEDRKENIVPDKGEKDIPIQIANNTDFKNNSIMSKSDIMNNNSADKMPVFGPPIQISLQPKENDSEVDARLNLKKKQFADSMFYDDAKHTYPTIEDQMKLCKLISASLTAAANKKARGACMFAKRQKRSNMWVHDGRSKSLSSDVSESFGADSATPRPHSSGVDDDGEKPLFQFRIPKLSKRVVTIDVNAQPALSKEDFEKLRLNNQRCEHNAVSPVTCFNIAADLQNLSDRGAKIFDKRRQHASEWVVEENVAKQSLSPINKPQAEKSLLNQNILEAEANLPKLNTDIINARKNMSLAYGNKPSLLEGPTFNRTAKGWIDCQNQTTVKEDKALPTMVYNSVRDQQNPTIPKPRMLIPEKRPYEYHHTFPRVSRQATDSFHQTDFYVPDHSMHSLSFNNVYNRPGNLIMASDL